MCLTHDTASLSALKEACLQLESSDWECFIQQLRWHRVTPLVWRKLSSIAESIPGGVSKKICLMEREARFRNLKHYAELERIGGLLQKNRLPYVCLKGPALSARLYQDASLRECRDLDVLAPREHITVLGRLLKEAGYRRVTPSDSASPLVVEAYLKSNKDFIFHNASRDIFLELHMRLDDNEYVLPELGEGLFERDYPYYKNEFGHVCLSAEDEFIYLVMHGARSCWARLSWLSDIDAYLSCGQVDIDAVVAKARRWKVEQPVLAALLMAHKLLSSSLPAAQLAHAQKSRPARLLCSRWEHANQSKKYLSPIEQYVLLCFFSFSKQYLMRHLTQFFRISANDIALLKLPRWMFPCYYLLRPFLWSWRYFISRKRVWVD
ncbi:nucleotidyltransferase family protein [Hahella aquimaris]|uniref:nucleotidyltransferase domain-containing protein n=1 Tax=Hahella sp. HNIBRBA332 TaxID=3015983 RepID=UPI00273A8D69|nr:nucleotidyltransferase family protein [Hahella sp. HNIBRBA332]WLQ17480.1 nucleotidyltransferase family protein [Hahella sp. HNIBRBA332]